MNDDHEQYLTRDGTAERLGVHPRTLHRWAEMGLLTPHRQAITRSVRYLRSDVESFAARRARLEPITDGDSPSQD